MARSALILYVKTGCPWCSNAEEYLDRQGYEYQRVDVQQDRAAFDEMERVSGQTYAPTLVIAEKVLADFGPEELEQFLREQPAPRPKR